MIKAEGLTKKYGRETVLTELDLSLERGAMAALTGVSGCGKTTLLKILAGMDQRYGGRYRLDGIWLEGLKDAELAAVRADAVGYIPQDIFLLEEESVRENILLPLRYKREPAGLEKQAEPLMEALGIAGLRDKKAKKLSGGEKKRVMTARALIKKPKILIADEPTAGVDRENCAVIMGLFRKMQQEGGTVLISTHDPAVYGACDGRIVMEYGKIAGKG